ncbi:MAG TPA: hypothetical protein DEQ61_07730 [Streptomyces sp.]|nr:hypothetical protein [Streptomyces sp.]
MPVHRVHALIDLCEVISGPSGRQLEGPSTGIPGVPIINPPDLTTEHEVDPRQVKQVSPETAAGLSRYRLRAGDLVYVRQGTLGRRAVVGPEESSWLFGPACLRIRPRSGAILPRYLLHYLGHPRVHEAIVAQANRGQAVETLASRTLAATPVFVPDLERQRAVAEVMEEVGVQVKVHRQLIAKHEAFGRGLLADLLNDAFDDPSAH